MNMKRSAVKSSETGQNSATVNHACRTLCRLLLFVFTAAVLLAPLGWGQAGSSTGTVRGTVFDAQGALVPNATVTITNPSTGTAHTVTTSAEGNYQASALNPGTYSLQIQAQGFDKLVATEIVVTVGQTVEYDAHLRVGSSSMTVEVTGNSAPLIDATQTQQANTIDERQQVNLPNVSRNFAQQIYTLPGIVDSSSASVQDPNVGTGYQASGFSIGGSSGRSNLFTLDGGENDSGSGAPRVAHVPQDSVQEFQVNRNSFGAEFGFTVGSAINVVTRSGTNKLHGKAFGYFHNHSTDAVNYFNSFGPSAGTKPFEQSAIFGGSLGGAIKKDKLFFFTSYERQKLDSAVTTNPLGSAAAQGVQGQAQNFNGTSCPAPVTQACYLTQISKQSSDPFLAGTAAFFLGSSIFSPAKDPIFNALVGANSGTFDGNAGGGAVQAAPNQNGRYNNSVSRVDYQPNQVNSYALRFSLTRESNQVIGAGGVPRFTSIIQTIRDYTITGSWNHVFNPNTVNTVRVQIVPKDSVDNVAPRPGVEFDLGSLGVQGTPFDFPYNQRQNQYQFDDDLSLTKGSHNLKFGFSYRPVQYDIFQAFLFGGQYQYFDGAIPVILLAPTTPSATPGVNVQTALAIFNLTHGYPQNGPASTYLSGSQLYVAGLPLALLQAGGSGQYNATTNPVGIYAQDSWKATHNLTLNYGGRFDLDPEPNGYPTSYRGSPRLGLAWDPYSNGKTVVRAGFGLFTAPVPFIVPFTSTVLNGDGSHIYASAPTAPNFISQLIGIGRAERSLATVANPNPSLSPAQFTAASGLAIAAPGANSKASAFFSVDPNFKPEYSLQSSASVAQELVQDLSLELSYLFYRGVHIQQIQENNFVQNTALAIDPFVGPIYMPRSGTTFGAPNTAIVQNDETTSAGSSTYHALTASLTKRFSRGLQFQANYTWSKAIDNASDFSSQSTPFRPGLLQLDRAISDFNIKHSFVANAVYFTPLHHRGDSLTSLLYSNFVIAPIVSVRSGVPFTLLTPGIASNGTGGAHTSEARPYKEGRNLGQGPGYARFDMRISRDIFLKPDGGVKLEIIAQAENVLNHTNFNRVQNIFPPNATVNAAGVTTSALVSTPQGTVDLLNGPYNYKGFRPVGAAQLSSPLAFQSAALPRQISFGLELSF